MDIVEILKLGLPGLVFLLSMMSFKLLSGEQQKSAPRPGILKSIKQFMYVNILLAILTAASPFWELGSQSDISRVFNVAATLSQTPLDSGSAAVCQKARYSGHYILITDSEKTKMVQVYAMGILPCAKQEIIALDISDAAKLGWGEDHPASQVEVAAAQQGQKYVLETI